MVRGAFVVALALVASPAMAQTPAAAETPVIVTQGDATVKRAPDQAWVAIASETRAAKPADAQRLGATAMTAVQTALKSQGLPADAIKTTTYSLQPDMEYAGGATRVKGYIARNQIEVRVDVLDKLGEVLDTAGSSGATSIAGLRFEIKGRDVAEREALRLAVKDAMSRAEAMAAGAGRTLGPILRIEEQSGGRVVPMYRAMADVRQTAAPPTPIVPGEIEIRAQVTLTVAIAR